jgi:hypothetical protein
MVLDKHEHSILAYFSSSYDARRAADELQEADLVPGINHLQVNSISRNAVFDSSYYNDSFSAVTLQEQTLYSNSGRLNQSPNPLLAANNLENGVDDDSIGKNFVVTLVTHKNNIAQAVQIIRNNGGLV